jgi:hypothetical protein
MSVNWFALWGWGKIGPGWIGWSADVLSFASFRMVSPVLLGCWLRLVVAGLSLRHYNWIGGAQFGYPLQLVGNFYSWGWVIGFARCWCHWRWIGCWVSYAFCCCPSFLSYQGRIA